STSAKKGNGHARWLGSVGGAANCVENHVLRTPNSDELPRVMAEFAQEACGRHMPTNAFRQVLRRHRRAVRQSGGEQRGANKNEHPACLFCTRAQMTLTRSVSEGERFTALRRESSQGSVRPRSRFGLVCVSPNLS